jgi:Family of unknown function (DUF6232)
MTEQTFLNASGIVVTSATLKVNSKHYAIANITSFEEKQENPDTNIPDKIQATAYCFAALIAFGAWNNSSTEGILHSLLSALISVVVLVIPLLAIAILWKRNQKTKYSIILNTAAGELQAIETTDKTTVQLTLSALENALLANASIYR